MKLFFGRSVLFLRVSRPYPDVRPRAEFEVAHLPYARSLPLTELERRLAELPRNKEIVAYCRGPFCLLSDEAVTLLTAKG